MTVRNKVMDHIAAPIIRFLAGLHDCHICNCRKGLINGKGKERTICTKYGMHISRVRDHCIDRFPGVTFDEIREIARQYVDGTCEIALEGVGVMKL